MTDWTCKDCGVDTHETKEYYMLKNKVWNSCVFNSLIMLCIGCIEKRLGRKLVPEDFMDCSLNSHFDFDDKSDRLLDRMGVSKEQKNKTGKVCL